MELSTTVFAKRPLQIQKGLQCFFDHPFHLVAQGSKQFCVQQLTNDSVIPYLIRKHSLTTHSNTCLIAYKFSIQIDTLKQLVMDNEQLAIEVYQYELNNKRVDLRINLRGRQCRQVKQSFKHMNDSTYIVELRQGGKCTRLYLLPFSHSHQEKDAHLTRAVHQNFKFLRAVGQYLRLDNCEGNVQFEEPILLHLSKFLYENAVSSIQFLLWVDNDQFDLKLLQRVGEIQLPQPWLEKNQYRAKKREVFEMRLEQHKMLTAFRQQKADFTATVTELQLLAGISEDPYQLISVESLKKLKQESIGERANEVKQLESLLGNLQMRLITLQQHHTQCFSRKSQNQKKHVTEILRLKREVSELQQSRQGKVESQGLIFNRSLKSVTNNVIKTIFKNTDKKAKRMQEAQITQINRYSNNTDNGSEPHQKPPLPKSEFRNNQKKVASVVREGKGLEVNIHQLREDYENELLRIDFEMEKRYSQLLGRFEKAAEAIAMAMNDNEEIAI